jgi:transmembrane sensor
MEEDNRHITDEDRSLHIIDAMDGLDKMADKEVTGMLSDSEHRELCRTLLECGESKWHHDSPLPNTEKAWENFEKTRIRLPRKEHQMKMFIYSTIGVAAAAIIAVLFLLHFNQSNDITTSKSLMAFSASNTSQKITISEDGQPSTAITTSHHDSYIITDKMADFSSYTSARASIRSIATPRGKDYKIILNDGTTVLMNADSKLTFPTRFGKGERAVTLSGEAYFKVSKNKAHPFVVYTENVKTRVLGTEFNLRAYPSSDVHVTLINGSIVVNDNLTQHAVQLRPGQDAELKGHDFSVKRVDTDYYIQWKDGYFYFDDVPLIEVMKELGRWYNVNIEIASPSLLENRLHFIADRSASINEVIDNLNSFGYLNVRKEGNKLVFSQKR